MKTEEIENVFIQYAIDHPHTKARDLIFDVTKELLPEIDLYTKRVTVCKLRNSGVIKYNGFTLTVERDLQKN